MSYHCTMGSKWCSWISLGVVALMGAFAFADDQPRVRNGEDATRVAGEWLLGLRADSEKLPDPKTGGGVAELYLITPFANVGLSPKCPSEAKVVTKVRALNICLAKDKSLIDHIPISVDRLHLVGVERDPTSIQTRVKAKKDNFPAGLKTLSKSARAGAVYFVQFSLLPSSPDSKDEIDVVIAVATYPIGKDDWGGGVIGAVANVGPSK